MTTVFQLLLRDNWQAFEALNQRAGHQVVFDPLMMIGDIVVGVLCGFVGSVFAVALRAAGEPLLAGVVRLAERVHLA